MREATALLAIVVLSVASGAAWADAPHDTRSDDASAPARSAPVLAELPTAPKIALAPPKPDDLEDLDALLSRLRDPDPRTRESASREVLEAKPSWVSAIDHRMNEIADHGGRNEMGRAVEEARKLARTAERKKLEAEGKHGKVETPDYLTMLTEFADPKSKPWQEVTAVIAMSRMLVQIGTVEAARELIDEYSRFGEFLRVDVQLQLTAMGDKAVAALIEARRHKAEKIGHWAARQLDSMGKAIPSESVQTEDHQVLSDVLRAWGRVRDPDAARIVISFGNTERSQVRQAARQAVAMMGDVANWQLRDSYEDLTGKKPPRDWTWDRTARELFAEFDRQRLARVYDLFDAGLSAKEKGNLDEMRAAFDKVLARSPVFDRRAEMVPGYMAFAEAKLDDDRPAALDALERAERLTDDDAIRKKAKSLALTVEGEQLAANGIADQVLFQRAIELDPGNSRAKETLGRLQRGELEKESRFSRHAVAGVIGLAALFAIGFIGLWGRRGRSGSKTEAEPQAETETETETETEAESETETEAESEFEAESESEAELDAESKAKAESESEARPKAEPESESESATGESESERKSESTSDEPDQES